MIDDNTFVAFFNKYYSIIDAKTLMAVTVPKNLIGSSTDSWFK